MPEPIRVVAPLATDGGDNIVDGISQDPAATQKQQQPSQSQQEQLLAGKFKTVEELTKGYQELEKKLGSREPAQTAPKVGDPITPPKVEEPKELDLAPFQEEYDKNGKLSDESYAKLQKEYKVGRNTINEFIEARVAKVQAFQKEVYDSVGGQETFGQMLEWAKGNLSASEQAAYDKAMGSGDPGVIKLAVAAVNAKFSAAFGSSPNLIGGRAGAAGAKPFKSHAEMIQAMSDPRYERDDAYRAEVENRVAVSDIL